MRWHSFLKFLSRSLGAHPAKAGGCSGRRKPSRRRLQVERLEDRVALTGTVTGRVFQDYNANGVFDTTASVPNAGGTGSTGLAIDRGLAGIVVRAFDAAGVQRGTATTASNGTYTLNASGTGPYHIQFRNLPAGFFAGRAGPGARGMDQFVPNGTSSNINLALVRPQDYSQNNPDLVTSCYVFGDQINGPNSGSPVIVSFPYAAGSNRTAGTITPGGDFDTPASHALAIPANQVGTTWGLAWAPRSRRLYASAFFRRHSGFGPGGANAIYVIDPATNSVVNTFQVGPNTNLHGASFDDDNGNIGWNAAGTSSLGGIALSTDGSTLYVMHLENRTLYRLNAATGAVLGSQAVPLTAPNATGPNDLRPFAVTFAGGNVYVGMVNTAESTNNAADLRAYVYRVNPVTLAFSATPVLQFALNYPRGVTLIDLTDARWRPWRPTFTTSPADPSGPPAIVSYPQPILSDITFDANGDLILGLRDRFGDQVGFTSLSGPAGDPMLYAAVSGGDTLRAAVNGAGGWVLESGGRAGGLGSGPTGTGEGPGNAEFYHGDNLDTTHSELSLGGGFHIPGHPDVVLTVYNPIPFRDEEGNPNGSDGGVRWLSNTTGGLLKAYRLYDGTLEGTSFFGKANGLGDIVALSSAAPLEIGNRVWRDGNRNGIQDPGEPGITDVTVQLFLDGQLVGTTTTDINGEYYFNDDNVDGGLQPNTAYEIRIAKSQAALAGLGLSPENAAGDDTIDSDAEMVGDDAVIFVTTGEPGETDHSFDFGFGPNLSLGNRVWNDLNNNGRRDPGEPGIANVPVRLYRDDDNNGTPDNSAIATTTTDANGYYLFTGLEAGTYIVEIVAPNGFFSSTGLNGSTTTGPFEGAATPDPDDDVDDDDNGTGGSGLVRSKPVTLGAGTEPTGEDDVVSPNPDTARDADSNLTVDFGLFEPPSSVSLSLGNRVWNDLNNNGRRDPGEPGIANVPVRLYRDDDNDGTPDSSAIATTTTDANGYYLFTDLGPGTYIVEIVAPSGFFSSTGLNGSATGPFEGAATPDPDNNVDDDDNGTGGSGLVRSRPVTLASGTEPTGETDIASPNPDMAADADSNLTVDFGLFQPSSLGDRVWLDLDGDGIQDAGEPGVPDVLVGLLSAEGFLITTTRTDENGNYRFTNLGVGSYIVAILPPQGLLITLPGRGTDNAFDSDVNPLTGRTVPINVPAGDTNFTVDVGLIRAASLSGFVYVDRNTNRVRDNPDAPAPGVLVTLVGVTDLGQSITLTDRTGDSGSYFFSQLRPGVYQITATTPSNFQRGTTNPGTTGGTPESGRLSNVNLRAGNDSRENNFGLLQGRVAGKSILLVSTGRRRRRRR